MHIHNGFSFIFFLFLRLPFGLKLHWYTFTYFVSRSQTKKFASNHIHYVYAISVLMFYSRNMHKKSSDSCPKFICDLYKICFPKIEFFFFFFIFSSSLLFWNDFSIITYRFVRWLVDLKPSFHTINLSSLVSSNKNLTFWFCEREKKKQIIIC